MELDANPYTLFLILILLILGTQPNSEKELDKIADNLDVIKESTTLFRTGLVRIQSIMS